MTALIYKAALPTYSSAEALAANADENLVLNDAGTAYELDPAQGGAYVRATWPEVTGIADGTDYYPVLTPVASAGTDIVMSGGGFSVPAGAYDVSIFYWLTSATAAGLLYVYLDGPAQPYDLLAYRKPGATTVRETATIFGLPVAAPTILKVDLYYQGAGLFTVKPGQVVVRKIA